MPVYVEVWCEKDALAGVLLEETEVYDVPLMTRHVKRDPGAGLPKPWETD
jgi:hypothetical protein